MRRSTMIDRTATFVMRSIALFSIYLLFAGHNQPGGGFVGGIIAGSAVAFAYVAGGPERVRGLIRPAPWTVLGSGLIVSSSTALLPILLGNEVLRGSIVELSLPLLGDLKVTSATAFDIGVYIVVVGVVLMVIEAFGAEEPAAETGPDAVTT